MVVVNSIDLRAKTAADEVKTPVTVWVFDGMAV
jgi:hypothetical protein